MATPVSDIYDLFLFLKPNRTSQRVPRPIPSLFESSIVAKLKEKPKSILLMTPSFVIKAP